MLGGTQNLTLLTIWDETENDMLPQRVIVMTYVTYVWYNRIPYDLHLFFYYHLNLHQKIYRIYKVIFPSRSIFFIKNWTFNHLLKRHKYLIALTNFFVLDRCMNTNKHKNSRISGEIGVRTSITWSNKFNIFYQLN
jgi:hypothetical protein